MSSANSPSPSESLDLHGPIPGTWLLVALVFAVHVVGGLQGWWDGFDSLFDALIGSRTDRLKLAIGAQDAGMIRAGDLHMLWTSVLVHSDLLHLLFNASALYVLGRLIEPWIGARRLWAWFWIGGVLGALTSFAAALQPQTQGASGGAYTLLGAALVLGAERRSKLDADDAWLVGPVLWGFTGLNLLLSVVLPFIDLPAHLGGLLAGLLLGGAIGRRKRWYLAGFEWLWLMVSTVLLGLGWFVSDVFRSHFWNVWMLQDPLFGEFVGRWLTP